MKERILKGFEGFTIREIYQVYYPKSDWRSAKMTDITDSKLLAWINFYKGYGATKIGFIVKDEEGKEWGLERDINELLN